jgi:predicted nucleic acid-binding protein
VRVSAKTTESRRRAKAASGTRAKNEIAQSELAGRQKAVRRGLRVAGTLSVLDEADKAGLVNFNEAIAQLRRTSFRVSEAVVPEIMQKRSR